MPKFEIVPSGGLLGADIIGFNAADKPDDDAMARIRASFCKYGVLCFRGQTLDEDQLIAFTSCFGEIESYVLSGYSLDEHPEILIVSNIL